MAFQVLHRTNDWLVIDKPAGTDFHSQSGQPGLMVELSEQLGCKVWPVHRLDKVTSGCLLVATSASAAAQLSEQFAARSVTKEYLAIAAGKPKKKQGWVKGDMAKSRNGCWKLVRGQNNPAVTQFTSTAITDPKVEQALDSSNQVEQATATESGAVQNQSKHPLRLYHLMPKTGKTHQLRVMMKSIGVPIIGDQRYGGLSARRCYLHAYRLSFKWHGETITVCSIPQDHAWSAISFP